ncbi:MAG TPA: rhodanese-like domain-containing protein [Treponemataceae bacterium]|nr:rhodanese-like domain-containing protein [Treponemataceae bacterium]
MKNTLGLAIVCCASMSMALIQAEDGKIAPDKAKQLLASDSKIVLLDVRTQAEYVSGHIARAILLPYDEITATTAAKAIPAKDATVIVYCRSGRRSAIAAAELKKLGYSRVFDLGGINDWPYEVVK